MKNKKKIVLRDLNAKEMWSRKKMSFLKIKLNIVVKKKKKKFIR